MYREEFKTICRSIYPCCYFEEYEDSCSILTPILLGSIMTADFDKTGEVVKLTNDYPKGRYKVKITEENIIKQIKWHIGNYNMYHLMENTYNR